MTGLPSPGRSRVVIIGFGRYRHLPDLPAIANNVADLAAALGDPRLWGIPPENCSIVSDRDGAASVPDVIEAVRRAARDVAADGLLLIYYAGHGLIDSSGGRLHLAVPGSERDEEDATAVAYESVRRRVWQSRAAHKLVILDCCYAGRALLGEMSGGGLGEDVEIDRSVIIAATSRNLVALAPRGARHTAFTGELLAVLDNGVPEGPPVLDAVTIWREVLRTQTAKGLPRPEFRSRNAAGDIPLVRNAWSTSAPPPAKHAEPGHRKRWGALAAAAVAVAAFGVLLPQWWPEDKPERSTATTPTSSATSPPTVVDKIAGDTCSDSEMSLSTIPAATRVKRGATLEVRLKIANKSARTCARDVGAGAQEIYLSSGATTYWSTDQCSPAKDRDDRAFGPGVEHMYKVTWNGQMSTACSGGSPAGPGPVPGDYEMRSRLGTLTSSPITVTILP